MFVPHMHIPLRDSAKLPKVEVTVCLDEPEPQKEKEKGKEKGTLANCGFGVGGG
ncbi:hypothetical protein U1Q18_010296, partial [Sarracenia purpurea var. burkii]